VGGQVHGKQRLDQRSYWTTIVVISAESPPQSHAYAHPPALLGVGQQLHLAWTGSDKALNLLAADGTSYPAPTTLEGRTSPYSPALAPSAASVVLAWIGLAATGASTSASRGDPA
jgi:hypothetical protein